MVKKINVSPSAFVVEGELLLFDAKNGSNPSKPGAFEAFETLVGTSTFNSIRSGDIESKGHCLLFDIERKVRQLWGV